MTEPSKVPLETAPDAQLWQRWREGERVDVADFLGRFADLVTTERVAVLLVDQRERWQVGERVPAESYLRRFPALEADTEAVVELAFGEFLLREQHGEKPALEEYLWRFPDHQVRLRQQVALHRALQCNGAAGEASSVAESGQTTPGRSAADVPGVPMVPGYQVLEELGRGGMGVVYKAVQVGLNRLCALKMILYGGQAGPADLQRFHTEAEAIARLQHPNIVAVHEIGEHDGKPFFSLEYCSGGSLDRKLAGTPLPASEAATLVRTLADAVHAAHQANVIHRDLKPANILLQFPIFDFGLGIEDNTDTSSAKIQNPKSKIQNLLPKITDFGLAKKLDAGDGPTQTGAVMGTPSYMAPEQAGGKGKEIGPGADVYSLGAILYECLTGRPPFKAATALDTMFQVVHEEPVPPRQLNGKVPADLETITLKCLLKEPSRRYGSAAELADDLGRFLAGEPIRARRVGRPERAVKWVRRNPVGAGLLAGVILAVATGGWILWERVARQEATEHAVSLALGKTEQLLEQVRQMPSATSQEAESVLAVWQQAAAALSQAEAALSIGTSAHLLRASVRDLREKVEQGLASARQKDKLLRELDEARMMQSNWIDTQFNDAGASAKFAEAFAGYGLEVKRGLAAELAQRIRELDPDLRDALIVALDEWIFAVRREKSEWLATELAEIVRAADDDAWRQKFRRVKASGDRAALRVLSAEARRLSLPPSSIYLLVGRLASQNENDEARALLRWARSRHPSYFKFHFELSQGLRAIRDQTPTVVEETIGCLRAALALRPRESAVLNNLGIVLRQKKELDEAIDCFRKAIEVSPRHAYAHDYLGLTLQDKGKMEEAIECFRKAADIDPKNANAHVRLGSALLDSKKVDEAIACMRKAIGIDSRNVPAHTNLGNAFMAKGTWVEAGASYRRAIEIDPKFTVAHNNLGNALNKQGKLQPAVASYKKAIECDPRFTLAHFNLGRVLSRKGQVDEAIACYQKAIAIDPQFANAYNSLGSSLYTRGKFDESIACYKKALDIDPRFTLAHYNLGLALKARGKVDEGVASWRKAIVLDPRFAPAHGSLGAALLDKGEVDEAITCYRTAVALIPTDSFAFYNLGVALKKRGRLEEAIACWRKALEIDPKFAHAHGALGQGLLEQGKFLEAQKALRRSLSLHPADHPLRAPLSQLLSQCRQWLEVDGKLKEYLAGKDVPADPAVRLQMAVLAQQPYNQLPLAAARLYCDALARQPGLASAHHYHAACCAARAACGQGKDAQTLTSGEQLRWRRQALTWLRAALAQHRRQLNSSDPKSALPSRKALLSWQKERALASLRDRDALARLSSEERQACEKLWTEVAELLSARHA